MRIVFLGLGVVFGFILSRAGATTYDYYVKLFLFQDLQLFWVIITAALVGAHGVLAIRYLRPSSSLCGKAINLHKKPYTRALIPGSLIFGVGWGIAGACPGTALAMLGEGKLGAAFTIVGLILGTALYGVTKERAAHQSS